MLHAKRAQVVVAAAPVGLLLLRAAGSRGTTIVCKPIHLKTVNCVRGTVFNVLRQPVPEASVTIIEIGAERATVKTNVNGKFSFDGLNAGSYVVQVHAQGYRISEFPIVVAKPGGKCKRALEIELNTGYPESCTAVRLVRP